MKLYRRKIHQRHQVAPASQKSEREEKKAQEKRKRLEIYAINAIAHMFSLFVRQSDQISHACDMLGASKRQRRVELRR